jgi:hypothetical protein
MVMIIVMVMVTWLCGSGKVVLIMVMSLWLCGYVGGYFPLIQGMEYVIF